MTGKGTNSLAWNEPNFCGKAEQPRSFGLVPSSTSDPGFCHFGSVVLSWRQFYPPTHLGNMCQYLETLSQLGEGRGMLLASSG